MKWISIGGCVLALCVTLAWRYFSADVISDTKRARLRPGMTTNEVVEIIGPPTKVWNGIWIYEQPLKVEVGMVFFDHNGHFEQAYND